MKKNLNINIIRLFLVMVHSKEVRILKMEDKISIILKEIYYNKVRIRKYILKNNIIKNTF